MGALAVWLIFWAGIGGLLGWAIGNGKGRGTEGFWLGFLLGFIGWIIVAVMEPSEEVLQQRTANLAAAINPTEKPRGPMRDCPWCAEEIRSAARVCRFCGRDVDPISENEIRPTSELERVRDEFPATFEAAAAYLAALPEPPQFPARWLRELCKRMNAGSPPQAAAARIPLDWEGALSPPPPGPTPSGVVLADPAAAGDFPAVAREFPSAYDAGRAALAGCAERPAHPEAWLRELCKRIDAGSPPEAAASRIPLDLF